MIATLAAAYALIMVDVRTGHAFAIDTGITLEDCEAMRPRDTVGIRFTCEKEPEA